MASGKIIYHNKSTLAIDYFNSLGYECPPRTNPADYFMAIMSIETVREEIAEERGSIVGTDPSTYKEADERY